MVRKEGGEIMKPRTGKRLETNFLLDGSFDPWELLVRVGVALHHGLVLADGEPSWKPLEFVVIAFEVFPWLCSVAELANL